MTTIFPEPTLMERSDALASALADQKQAVLLALGSGQDIDGIERAIDLMRFAAPVWIAVGFDVLATLTAKISGAIDGELRNEREYLANCRANDRTRAATVADIARLEKLRESL